MDSTQAAVRDGWLQFTSICQGYAAASGDAQRLLARATYEAFGTVRQPYGEHTVEDLADAIDCSRSSVYELMGIYRCAGVWWDTHPEIPIGILRVSVRWDPEGLESLLDRWVEQGRPSYRQWCELLDVWEDEPTASDDRKYLLRAVRRLARFREVVSSVRIRQLRPRELAILDEALTVAVHLRRRLRSTIRHRRRVLMLQRRFEVENGEGNRSGDLGGAASDPVCGAQESGLG